MTSVVLVSVALGGWSCHDVATAAGNDGKPVALDLVWHVHTAANRSIFFLGTPTVDNGVLYLEDGNTVLALDAQTGAKRWARPVRSGPFPFAEVVLARDGRVYVSEADSVLAMQASDGKTIWNFHPDSIAVAYASIDDRALYTGQRGIPVVYALDLADGHLRWKVNIGPGWEYTGYVNGTAVSGDTVYVAGRKFLAENGYISKGILVALDRNDGHEFWRYETAGQYGGLQGAPTVSGPYLVVSDLLGNAFFAYDRFALKEVWRIKSPDNGPLTPPIVVDGVVYAGSADRYLYAVDLPTGALKWKQSADGSIGGTAYCAGQVFVENGAMQRRDPAHGAYTGYFNPSERGAEGAPLTSNIATDGQKVYVAGEDGVYALACK